MLSRRIKLLALAFALGLGLLTIAKARRLDSPDFKVFYTAARFVHVDPSKMYVVSPDRYLYPPSTAVLLAPFGATENYEVAEWAWHGLLTFLVFLLASPSTAALLALALLTRYLLVTLAYGQINLVVVALLAGAGAWLKKRPRLAGGVWALATSLKVYPVVFAPAFFSRGSRRGLLAAAVVGALILLLPILVFGSLGIDLYRQFFASLGDKGMPLHSHNQSIVALLSRLFTNQNFYLHAVGNAQWNVLSLPPLFVRVVAVVIGLAMAGLSWKKVKDEKAEPLSATAFSVLFLSHIVWKDYFLLLYFPLRELFGKLPRRQASILAAAFLAVVTISSPDLVGFPLGARLDASCIHLWGAVLVWGWWIRKAKA